MNKTEV